MGTSMDCNAAPVYWLIFTKEDRGMIACDVGYASLTVGAGTGLGGAASKTAENKKYDR